MWHLIVGALGLYVTYKFCNFFEFAALHKLLIVVVYRAHVISLQLQNAKGKEVKNLVPKVEKTANKITLQGQV